MINGIKEIYKKFKIRPEDLSIEEKEELQKIFNQLPKAVSLGEFTEYINKSIYVLETNLYTDKAPRNIFGFFFNRRRRLFEEARLKNYIEIREIFERPERAKVYLERQMKKLANDN